MVRRLLYLVTLVAALCASACGDTKSPTTGPKVVDPDANPVPKPGGAKAG